MKHSGVSEQVRLRTLHSSSRPLRPRRAVTALRRAESARIYQRYMRKPSRPQSKDRQTETLSITRRCSRLLMREWMVTASRR